MCLVGPGLGCVVLLLVKCREGGVSAVVCVILGRIFQHVHGEEDVGMAPLINPQNLPRVVSTLLESTRDEPHIAEQICYALSQLAAGFKDSDTSLFSPYFADIVQSLLQQVSASLSSF